MPDVARGLSTVFPMSGLRNGKHGDKTMRPKDAERTQEEALVLEVPESGQSDPDQPLRERGVKFDYQLL